MTFCCFLGQVCMLQIRDFSEQIISEKTLDSAIELRLAVNIAIILIIFEIFLSTLC